MAVLDPVLADRQHRPSSRRRNGELRPSVSTSGGTKSASCLPAARTRRTAPGESSGRRAAVSPVGVTQEGRVVVPRASLPLRSTWSLPNRIGTPHLARQRPQLPPRRSVVLFERERRGRLRPDHELRAAADDVARHRDVGREDAPRLARIPLVLLRDVALDEADAQRRALAASASRRRPARRPSRPPRPARTTVAAIAVDPLAAAGTAARTRCAAFTNATSADSP